MFVLWKKESSEKDAPYVDLLKLSIKATVESMVDLFTDNDQIKEFKNILRNKAATTEVPKKSNVIAEKNIIEGNHFYEEENFLEAIDMYNKSLCFVESGSLLITFIYAKRSECYFHLKKYDQCLIDIDLAIEAGYPDQLISKLENLKTECLDAQKKDKPELNIFAQSLGNEKFPSISKMVELRRYENKCSATAKVDIPIGQIVALEDAFTVFSNVSHISTCNICTKKGTETNLVPCDRCTNVMFCFDDCKRNAVHEYECGVLLAFSVHDMECFRATLLAINMFNRNIGDLMKFVEDTNKSDPGEVPDNLIDAKSKYRAFLKSSIHLISNSFGFFVEARVYPVYKIILDTKLGDWFNTKQKRRFLLHLITHHILIIDCNRKSYVANRFIEQNFIKPDYTSMCITGVIRKYFEHSCAPNTKIYSLDNHLIYVAIRPIKSGEPLCISIKCFFKEETEERKEMLKELRYLDCDCARCNLIMAPKVQRNQMNLDPDYKFIISNMGRPDLHFRQLYKKCRRFLEKYDNMVYCNEIYLVSYVYASLLAFIFGDVVKDLLFAEVIKEQRVMITSRGASDIIQGIRGMVIYDDTIE